MSSRRDRGVAESIMNCWDALINRYVEWFPRFLRQEGDWEGANMLAVLRAVHEVFGETPETDEELAEQKTPRARRLNMFFGIMESRMRELIGEMK